MPSRLALALTLTFALALSVGATSADATRLAVAVPFHVSQIRSKLIPGLRRWKDEAFFPCKEFPAVGREASLVLVYAGHSDQDLIGDDLTVKQALEDLATELEPVSARCFPGGLHLMRTEVPIEATHPADAPCSIFQAMLQRLRESSAYDHVFQMETDVLPVRNYWLDALLDEASVNTGCKRFWQLGSMSHCQPLQDNLDQRFDMHINGNSLWCLRDPGLWNYMDRVKSFYPAGDHSAVSGCGTSRFGEAGMDHSLYRFRRDPSNWEYIKKIWHKFQYTQLVLNKCEDSYSIAELRTEHPETFLVHSKAPFLPEDILMARDLVTQIFSRWPQSAEQHRLASMLTTNRWSKDQLAAYLCESEEHIRMIQNKNPSPTCQQLCDTSPHLFPQYDTVCELSVLKKRWLNWEPDKAYVWTTDLHSGPMACNVPVLNDAGALVHGEIDFGNCAYTRKYQPLCKDRLKVLEYDEWRGFSLDPCPNYLRQAFFEAYKNDPEFERVDAFVCSHPAANCELYMPFNRSLIVYPTTRLEFGRDDDAVDWRQPYITLRSKARWAEWVQNIQRIAANPINIIAANSKYEVEYIKYHTGIKAQYLPSWCGDKTDNKVVEPSNNKVLLGPYRDNLDYPRFDEEEAWKHPIMTTMLDAAQEWKEARGSAPEFVRLRQHYKHYEFSDLQSHPCIVIIPYQVSVISFFEYYRLNVPLFVPSKSLLIKWHMQHNTLWERTYGHPDHLVPDVGTPDPASDDQDSLEFWLGLADYYQFEHVIQFDSWQDFMFKYTNTDLLAVRHHMAESNAQQRSDLVDTWANVLAKVKSFNTPRVMPKHFTHALEQIYNAPALGPDLPVTLDPEAVSSDTVELAKQCPVISESLPRCMCVNGTMPDTNAPECHHLPRCIPSHVYQPPTTNDTNRLSLADDDWVRQETAVQEYGEAWNKHRELNKNDPAKPAASVTPPQEVQTSAISFPTQHRVARKARRFFRQSYSWRRSGTGTGSGTTSAPTTAPTVAPTVSGTSTEQTTSVFTLTTTTPLSTSEQETVSTGICSYLENNSDNTITWTCTTAPTRRNSYATTSVATYPSTSSSTVSNLVSASGTKNGAQSSANSALSTAGSSATVTVDSVSSSTTCIANCGSSSDGVATWVIVVSVLAGVIVLGAVVGGIVWYTQFRTPSSDVGTQPSAAPTGTAQPAGGQMEMKEVGVAMTDEV